MNRQRDDEPFVATAVMQLVAESKMCLDCPLQRYLPRTPREAMLQYDARRYRCGGKALAVSVGGVRDDRANKPALFVLRSARSCGGQVGCRAPRAVHRAACSHLRSVRRGGAGTHGTKRGRRTAPLVSADGLGPAGAQPSALGGPRPFASSDLERKCGAATGLTDVCTR